MTRIMNIIQIVFGIIFILFAIGQAVRGIINCDLMPMFLFAPIGCLAYWWVGSVIKEIEKENE